MADPISQDHLFGQALSEEQTEALAHLDPNAPLHERLLVKHRRLLGFIIPIVFWQLIWWTLAITVSQYSSAPFPQQCLREWTSEKNCYSLV